MADYYERCPNCKDADMQYPVDDGYPAFCVNCGYVEGELING